MRYAIMMAQKNKRRSSGVCPLSDARHDRVLGDKGIAVKVRGNSHYRNSRFDESSRNAYRPAMPIKVSRASGEVVHSGTAGIRLFHSTPRRMLLFYPFVIVTADDIAMRSQRLFSSSERPKMLTNTTSIRCAFRLSLMENYLADYRIAISSAVTRKDEEKCKR